MLSIAIKEENSHFEHGLKIIISHLANQWHQEISFCLSRRSIAPTSRLSHWMKIGSALNAIRFRFTPGANTGWWSATETIKISWCSGPACTCCRWSIGKMTLTRSPKISPHLAKTRVTQQRTGDYLPLLHHPQLFYRRAPVLNVSCQRIYVSRNRSPALNQRYPCQSNPSQHYEKAAREKRSAILKIHPGASELSTKLGGTSPPNFLLKISHHQLSIGSYCTRQLTARIIQSYYSWGNRKAHPVIF